MAAIGAIASVLLASMMQPSLWYPPAVPCIGIIFGLVELTRYFRERERAQAARNHGLAPRFVASRQRGLPLPADASRGGAVAGVSPPGGAVPAWRLRDTRST